MALQTGVMNLPGGGTTPSAFGESPAKVLCLTEVHLPLICHITIPFLLS